MNQIGRRIIYNTTTGTVLNNCLGEMVGNFAEDLRPTTIDFIDLPFGSTILTSAQTYHIDITKDKNTTPIEKLIIIDTQTAPQPPTYEQLQQQLLQAQGVI